MGAEEWVPERPTLPKLREAAAGCRGCDLWKDATQTVFGEGTTKAEIMFVGEQPGDREDLEGEPFVGPAGRLLDEGLESAGIDRGKVYVTNAVKHFKWMPKGKRRIHRKPNAEQIRACRPWLDAEITTLKPKVIVCLGATAAQALIGKTFRVTKDRGRLHEWTENPTITITATVHPSSILRAPDEESRRSEMQSFIADLTKVASLIKS